jgi:hypothetical protein
LLDLFRHQPRALLRFDPRRFHFELVIVKIEDAFGLDSLSQIVSFQVSPSPETFSAGAACHQLVVFNVIGDLEDGFRNRQEQGGAPAFRSFRNLGASRPFSAHRLRSEPS